MRLGNIISLVLSGTLLLSVSCIQERKGDYEGIPKAPEIAKTIAQDYKHITEKKEIIDVSSQKNNFVHNMRVKNIGYLAKIFNDLNDTHLEVAKKNGISPISDLKTAYSVNVPIAKVETCDEFYLDTLSHSLPYLRPQALHLLKNIGKAFSDTVMARTGKKYTIRVTSVLRTIESVSQLRKLNRNASENSAHQYGLTFDVSYYKFISEDPNYILSLEDLKNTLGEILWDLRAQGKCYVKYERHQGCFHITAL